MRKERKKKPHRCPDKLRRPVLQYIRQLEFTVWLIQQERYPDYLY